MPVVKIELAAGKSFDFKKAFMKTVHIAVSEALQIPLSDNNQRMMEYDPDFFVSRPPYEFFIEIYLFAGRTKQTKKILFQKIVLNLQQELQIDPTTVYITLIEQPLENWGIRGGIPADEASLGFKVNI